MRGVKKRISEGELYPPPKSPRRVPEIRVTVFVLVRTLKRALPLYHGQIPGMPGVRERNTHRETWTYSYSML